MRSWGRNGGIAPARRAGRAAALGLTLLLALLAAPAAPALAQEYPVQTGELVVTGHGTTSGGVPVLEPSDAVRLAGGGFEPGATVTVVIESDPIVLATRTVGPNGSVDVTVSIPANMPAGDHTLKAMGASDGGGVLVLSQPVRVAGEERARSGLATTGRDLLPFAGGGAGLVAIGLLIVFASRRWRPARATSPAAHAGTTIAVPGLRGRQTWLD